MTDYPVEEEENLQKWKKSPDSGVITTEGNWQVFELHGTYLNFFPIPMQISTDCFIFWQERIKIQWNHETI